MTTRPGEATLRCRMRASINSSSSFSSASNVLAFSTADAAILAFAAERLVRLAAAASSRRRFLSFSLTTARLSPSSCASQSAAIRAAWARGLLLPGLLASRTCCTLLSRDCLLPAAFFFRPTMVWLRLMSESQWCCVARAFGKKGDSKVWVSETLRRRPRRSEFGRGGAGVACLAVCEYDSQERSVRKEGGNPENSDWPGARRLLLRSLRTLATEGAPRVARFHTRVVGAFFLHRFLRSVLT